MKKRLSTVLFPWLCVIAGIVVPLSILFYDGPERDECYQALSVLNYTRSPLAPLSFFNGYLWLRFFGETILNLRILNLLCHMVSIALGCAVFFRITRDKLWTAIIFMTLSIASQVWAMHIYNWDTGCYPFAMLCLLSTLAFWRKPSLKRLLTLAITASLFALSRIPCIVCIPVLAVAVAIRLRGDMRHDLFYSAVFLFSALFTGVGILLVIYGGYSGLVEAWNPDNVITGHGVTDVNRYITRLKAITPRFMSESGLSVLCVFFAWIVSRLRKSRPVSYVCMVGVIWVMVVALIYFLPVRTFFGAMFVPVCVLWLYPVCHRVAQEGRYGSPGYFLWITALFVLFPIIGSDGTIERFMLLPVFPLVASVYYDRLKSFVRNLTVFIFVAVCVMTCVKLAYYVAEGCHTVTDIAPRMGAIRVNGTTQRSIKEQIVVHNAFDGKIRYKVYGSDRYTWSYYHNVDMGKDLHMFHYIDVDSDTNKLDTVIPELEAIVVFYPVYHTDIADDSTVDQEGNDKLESFIYSRGFKKLDSDFINFEVYMRDSIAPEYERFFDSVVGKSEI